MPELAPVAFINNLMQDLSQSVALFSGQIELSEKPDHIGFCISRSERPRVFFEKRYDKVDATHPTQVGEVFCVEKFVRNCTMLKPNARDRIRTDIRLIAVRTVWITRFPCLLIPASGFSGQGPL